MASGESVVTECGVSRSGGLGRLRIVVLTAGPLTAINRVFFERLAGDPLLDLSAIIVDEYMKPRKPLAARVVRALRKDGLAWLAFKLRGVLGRLLLRMVLWLFECVHKVNAQEESYETLERRTGVQVYRVADIHGEASLALIRSLRPHLGVIVGGRILSDAVLTIPEHGTLNIHKRKVPEYRGGGPVGYWEILAGESSIGVTVHYARARVDAGPVLAEATIPIEACDTLESLRIKADLLGARVYHDALRRFALGVRRSVDQDPSRAITYRAPSELSVGRLERRLRRSAAATMPSARRPHWLTRTRLCVQYVVLLPLLLTIRKRLIRDHRAPICILFYHLVANRPLNHMCLPLEEFVRQIKFLRRYYDLVSLPEAIARARSGKNDRISVSITFDDGYRDNVWALEYLRYFKLHACFFVSVGHVRDGTAFEHDRRRGFEAARPMSEAEIRQLAATGFVVGSHGLHHEDFGHLNRAMADRVLRESREVIGEICGQTPEHFSFPTGRRDNITAETFTLGMKHYPCVYSAYGGYNFPRIGRRNFLRIGNTGDVLGLAMIMDGYTGFRQCVVGNVWGRKTDAVESSWVEPRAGPGAPGSVVRSDGSTVKRHRHDPGGVAPVQTAFGAKAELSR